MAQGQARGTLVRSTGGPDWRSTAMKLVRFAIVGGSATLLYGLFAVALHTVLAVPAIVVHTLAYALAIPVSYLGQRSFTFRYRGPELRALRRFLVTAASAFVLSTGAVYLCDEVMNWHYLIGTAITMLIVPLVSFVTMLLWVFLEPRGAETV